MSDGRAVRKKYSVSVPREVFDKVEMIARSSNRPLGAVIETMLDEEDNRKGIN